MRSFSMIRPDDWHVHLRDGAGLPDLIAASAAHFSRVLAMPNLQPPLVSVSALVDYHARLMAAQGVTPSLLPYLSLYLQDTLSPDELHLAKAHTYILGAKLYPAGATTNSEHGVQSIRALYPLFETMQALDLVLQIHGEVTHGDIFEREGLFIEEVLRPLIQNFSRLRVVLEHISTREAVDFVMTSPANVAATITPHHLLYNRNQLLAGGIRPHYYCLPILKHERDQRALQQAAVSGDPRFFAGTDSAPHARSHKENACGCAGIFSAPFAVAMYAEVFDGLDQLDRLEGFMSQHGAHFYQLPLNMGHIELIQQPQVIPPSISIGNESIVPAGAGTVLPWRVQHHD